MSERLATKPPLEIPKSQELLETLLEIPGSTGRTYSRFHSYSLGNVAFLAMQGCPPEPVATFKKWQELDRQVQRGEKAYSILRPIDVKVKSEDEEEESKFIRRFKVVRALFSLSQTKGEELPPYEHPTWSVERALGALAIERVPFESYEGNIGGYAVERTIAINPLAPYPLRTTLHEISHVQHGHTTRDNLASYQTHRGQFEFDAEASAFLALNQLDALDEETASVSRGYCQNWMRDERPSEQSLRRVINVASKVVEAGYEKSSIDVSAPVVHSER